MRRSIIALCSVMLLGFCVAVSAEVLRVPSEYPTIQAGIDASGDGDTVLVADGIYTGDGNRDLDFQGRRIELRSENGPEATIIDSEGSWFDYHRAFYFHSGEGRSSVVRGIGVRGGVFAEFPGGGIRCEGSSPTVIECIFEDNIGDLGAGIYCEGGAPLIVGNLFLDNLALTT